MIALLQAPGGYKQAFRIKKAGPSGYYEEP